MPRTFKLVSGSDEVDLINLSDPGIIFSRGGAGPNRQRTQLTFTSSQLADGSNLRAKRVLPVAESYALNLKGSSHDNVASQLQALQRILRKGDQNALTNWQQEPLYIHQQMTNETNPRKSKVLAWNGLEISDFFDQPIESSSQIDDFEITLAREPYWRGTAPGVMPSIEAVKIPDFPWFDEFVGNTAGFDVTPEAAQEGDWGGAFTVSGAGSEIDGVDNLPNAETTLSLEIKLDPNSLTMTDADAFRIIDAISPGLGGSAYQIDLVKDGDDYELLSKAKNDAGGNATFLVVTLADASNLIRIEWVASTGPGNDDGSIEIFLEGVSKGSSATLDNDTHNVTSIQVGAVLQLDAGTSGTFFIDRYRWDDALAPTTYERTIDFEQTTAPLPNFRQSTGVLSHIFAEDNGTGFSANLVAEPSWPWFEVSGSTPVANDAMYFGSDEPFYNLVFNFPGGHDVSIAYDIEFSDGATGWISAPTAVFNVQYFTKDYVGMTALIWGGDPAWAADTVNGVAAKFWLRIKLTTVTTWTTAPEQADQIAYTANSPYLEFNNLQVHGDVPALMLQRLVCYNSENSDAFDDPEANLITNIVMGMKSRGLDTFFSRFNAGGDNPANWTEVLGTNTSQVAKESAPGGQVARITWATALTMANRVRFSLDVAAQDPNDFEGNYRVYVRGRQNGGSNGDTKLRYRFINTVAEFVGETQALVDVDNDELIDLGSLSMFEFGTLGDEVAGSLQFSISLEASSESTGVTNLELYDMVLMPSDEMFSQFAWSGKTNQYLQTSISMKLDAGILREGAILEHRPFQAAEEFLPYFTWQTKGVLPMLEPRRNARLYYLYWQDNNVPGTNISNQGQFVGGKSYLHERWNTMRGAD